MKLGEALVAMLGKKYPPSAMLQMRYKGKDLSVKTDSDGNSVVVFIGKQQADGKIKGERYTRHMVRDRDGNLIKDHWDLKGKA